MAAKARVTRVKMLGKVPPYNAGEIAGWPNEPDGSRHPIVLGLLQRGVAELVSEEAVEDRNLAIPEDEIDDKDPANVKTDDKAKVEDKKNKNK